MSYFEFPTWAQDKLGGNKLQAEPVQQMPRPTLDEIDAIDAERMRMIKSSLAMNLQAKENMESSTPKKRGRPAKAKA